MWIYKACISNVVCSLCSLFAEDCADSWLSSVDFISWTGGGLTMVIGMTTLSERRPFISLCSWHKAHQCMQQCTMHGSHGEFCSQQQHELANYKPNNQVPFNPFRDQQILNLKTTWRSTRQSLKLEWIIWICRFHALCGMSKNYRAGGSNSTTS